MFALKPYFDIGQQSFEGPRQFSDRYAVLNMRTQIHSENLVRWGVTWGRAQPGQNYVYPAWLVHYSTPTHPITVIDHANSVLEGGMMEHRECCESAYEQCPDLNQEFSAFGLSHAEHARKLYLSRATDFKSKSRHCTVPQYRKTLGHDCCLFLRPMKRTQNSSIRGYMPSRSRKGGRYDPIKRRVASPPNFEPEGPILKRATISTRPLLKKLKAQAISSQLRSHKHILGLGEKESMNFLENETKDSRGSTAFQILCEISKLKA